MDRTRRCSARLLRELVRRSPMGFHSQSFRFEGGGRHFYRGLGRTGKSCRLRWVNYLHPGLKRGKMTQKEEKIVMELHSKWGNRWSRIARNLPGRTDNEIKNYWRTRMRKAAQDKKKATSQTPSSNSSSSVKEVKGCNYEASTGTRETVEENSKLYSIDDIWKDIELSEENSCFTCPGIASPIWDFRSDLDSPWTMEEEERKMVLQQQQQQMVGFSDSYPFYDNTRG